MNKKYPRDMIGYGSQNINVKWPNNSRVALQFVLNYEEGAENNVLHGDKTSEIFLSEIIGAQPIKGRHKNMESLYEYGSRAGFWRIHKLFSLELLPRITRAQSMDILSSQANLAGYKAVVESFANFEKAIPMMMTAAGTVPAAKVLVVGAGVAGLQAIATAKRMGAIVFATDVRMASKEQVESLGGKFLTVEGAENLETEGGYAKEASDDFKKKTRRVVK